jgi:hypothetical protein
LSPQVDLLILAALAWWLWRVHRRRGQEAQLYRAARLNRTARVRIKPAEIAHSGELGRLHARWADQFKRVRYAELRRDLGPVRSLVSSEVYQQLEIDSHRIAEMRPFDARLTVSSVQVVERWSEEGAQYVVVRFQGQLRRAEEGYEHPFEELWTFQVADSESEAWVVTSIERGERRRAAGDTG